jgi:hypothetical protein
VPSIFESFTSRFKQTVLSEQERQALEKSEIERAEAKAFEAGNQLMTKFTTALNDVHQVLEQEGAKIETSLDWRRSYYIPKVRPVKAEYTIGQPEDDIYGQVSLHIESPKNIIIESNSWDNSPLRCDERINLRSFNQAAEYLGEFLAHLKTESPDSQAQRKWERNRGPRY